MSICLTPSSQFQDGPKEIIRNQGIYLCTQAIKLLFIVSKKNHNLIIYNWGVVMCKTIFIRWNIRLAL